MTSHSTLPRPVPSSLDPAELRGRLTRGLAPHPRRPAPPGPLRPDTSSAPAFSSSSPRTCPRWKAWSPPAAAQRGADPGRRRRAPGKRRPRPEGRPLRPSRPVSRTGARAAGVGARAGGARLASFPLGPLRGPTQACPSAGVWPSPSGESATQAVRRAPVRERAPGTGRWKPRPHVRRLRSAGPSLEKARAQTHALDARKGARERAPREGSSPKRHASQGRKLWSLPLGHPRTFGPQTTHFRVGMMNKRCFCFL